MLFNQKNLKTPLIKDDEPAISSWLEQNFEETEGQLAVDVFQNDKEIVVKSTIAGAKPEDLKISLHNDLLVIKGERHVQEEVSEDNYLFRECYWGSFSRSIILPAEVDSRRVQAEIENGVLTITLPKIRSEKIRVTAKD